MPNIETGGHKADIDETKQSTTEVEGGVGAIRVFEPLDPLLRPEAGERTGTVWREIASKPVSAVLEQLGRIASVVAHRAEEFGRDVLEAYRPDTEIRIESLVETQLELERTEDLTEQEREFDPEVWVSGAEVELQEFVTEGALAERFRELREHFPEYVAHLIETDDQVKRLLEEICQRVDSGSAQDRQMAIAALRRNVAGRIAELAVRDALAPYFEKLEEQVRVPLDDGTTVIDLRCEGAVQPIRFGRDGLVEKGGELSVEVKVGKPEYLAGQRSHIVNQVSGHGASNISIVVVSKDVSSVQSGDLREPVKESGSSVWAFLPPKGEIDQLLMTLVEPSGASS